MDLFDRRILEVLSSGEARSFQETLSKAGFSHNTLRQRLDQLLVRGLVERRKEPKEGPGRPVVYNPECDLRALMLRQLEQIPYIKDLSKRLRREPYLRQSCGYGDKTPRRPTSHTWGGG